MKPFISNSYPTLGVEQEFHLIDPASAELVGLMEAVWGSVTGRLAERITYELFGSVLETCSDVARTPDELVESVYRDRAELAEACAASGAVLAAAGSHPFSRWDRQVIVDNAHYQWVRDHHDYIVKRMLAFGLHVHVGVRGPGEAIYIMNEMRRWAYPLLALSANSPYYGGRRTGLASTRLHLFHCMPRTSLAPAFGSFAELEALYEKLVAAGDITRPGDLWWAIRPQPPLGTVEFRVFDLPTDVRRIGALAAICQAACATYQDRFDAREPAAVLNDAHLDQNRWKAMRYDLDAGLIEPETGEVLTIREQLSRLLEFVGPKAAELGSGAYVDFARSMLREPTESQQQVATCEALGDDLRELELDIARRTVARQPLPTADDQAPATRER